MALDDGVTLTVYPAVLHSGDQFSLDVAERVGGEFIFGAAGAVLETVGGDPMLRWGLSTPWRGGAPTAERLPDTPVRRVVPAIGLSGPRPFKLPDDLAPGRYLVRLNVVDHRDLTRPGVSVSLSAVLDIRG